MTTPSSCEDRRQRILDWLWFLTWAVASSVWCVTAAGRLSATFDEPIYIIRGLEHWRTGSYAGLMQLGTMPLPIDVETLPLYLRERWQGHPFDAVGEMEHLLPWARLGTLVFWWLLLIHGRLAGRALAGPWGGRLAVALLACEPSFLAHASLATTDLAITACLLALVYHFRMGREAGWLRRVAWPACWFAAAVLAKASGLVFGPICLLVVEGERLLRQKYEPGRASDTRPPSWPVFLLRHDLLQIGVLGMLLVFLYCGSDWQPQASFVQWAHQLPPGQGLYRTSMVWLSEHLCIFSNAGEGLVRQVKHNVRGHGVYLLGHTDPRSLWWYFPVLLTIKLSVPLLLTPLLVLVLRRRALFNWALLAGGALLLFSLSCRVQIGVRLVLPLVGLVVVGVAAAAVETCRALAPGWRRQLLSGSLALALVWTVVDTVAVWPQGLCYVNELWGGTRQGYLQVSDANYDWGQGLKELARWQRRHGSAPLDVWYFGCDPSIQRLPMRHLPLHILNVGQPEDVKELVHGHYLAVSTTLLYGMVCDTPAHEQASALLLRLRPVARTSTFLIYDFTQESDQRSAISDEPESRNRQ